MKYLYQYGISLFSFFYFANYIWMQSQFMLWDHTKKIFKLGFLGVFCQFNAHLEQFYSFFLCAKDFPHKLFKKNGYTLRLSQTQPDVQYDRCGHLSLHRDNSATSAQKGVSRWKCQKCMVFLCLNANQRYLQTDINEMDVKTVLPPDSWATLMFFYYSPQFLSLFTFPFLHF